MDANLERYLNDHLAGSSGAVLIIQNLADSQNSPEPRDYFLKLKSEVEEDRKLLEKLLKSAGLKPSDTLKAAGKVAGGIGMMKMWWEGFGPGELGMFEALEALALGIQGKRLLWLALNEISPWFPEWREFDFVKLELDAIEQRDGVERWRLETARESLASSERRAD